MRVPLLREIRNIKFRLYDKINLHQCLHSNIIFNMGTKFHLIVKFIDDGISREKLFLKLFEAGIWGTVIGMGESMVGNFMPCIIPAIQQKLAFFI